jgi:hypothetical protein
MSFSLRGGLAMAMSPDNTGHDIQSAGDSRLLRAVAVLVHELEVVRAAPDDDRMKVLGSLGLTPNLSESVLELLRKVSYMPRKINPVIGDPHGPCPITWQPSISKPVFYGYRDFGPADGAPTDLRVFYPSLEGSPANATMLTGCGHYPLILFLHGHCQGDSDHYLRWYRLPAQLARSGYIVAVPHLAGIAGGTAPWTDPNDDLMTAHATYVWVREHPEITVHLAPFNETGIMGHSYGAMLGARVATGAPCLAYASLSAGWHDWISVGETIPLSGLNVPSLYTWGTSPDDYVRCGLEGDMQDVWDEIPKPKHKVAFTDAGHWDYLLGNETSCLLSPGPCTITHSLAADFVAAFFSKYMPPEKWSSLRSTIPDSLVAPLPSGLTSEEALFEGGHLMGFKMLPLSDGCSVTSSWEKSGASGSVTLSGS